MIARTRLPQLTSCAHGTHSTREAIECLKRALIGADPSETLIHSRLAKLFHELGDYAEAASYHQHNVEVGRAAGASRFLASLSPPVHGPAQTHGARLCPPHFSATLADVRVFDRRQGAM